MKSLLFAVLFSVACLVATADTAQAGTGRFVWHHATPIYVGGNSTSTHGTTIGTRNARVMRNWYGTKTRSAFFRR